VTLHAKAEIISGNAGSEKFLIGRYIRMFVVCLPRMLLPLVAARALRSVRRPPRATEEHLVRALAWLQRLGAHSKTWSTSRLLTPRSHPTPSAHRPTTTKVGVWESIAECAASAVGMHHLTL